MSLSRLNDLVKPYILDYLDPTGTIREQPKEIDIHCSKHSSGIKKVYTKNKALTLFVDKSPFAQQVYHGGLRGDLCLHNDYRSVHHNDADHESYHKSPTDFDEDHAHILKGRTHHVEMLDTEVKCIIDNIKNFEKQLDVCKDGKTECLLADRDANRIVEGYQKYARQNRRAHVLDANVEKMYAEMEARFISGAQSFSHAFMTTMIDRYITPFLITQCINRQTATWSMEIVKSVFSLGLSSSLMNAALDVLIRNALSTGLTQLGMNPDVVEKIAREIGAVIAVTTNPFSLIEMGINSTSAAAGQAAAYQVIRALPKLKYEPEVSINTAPDITYSKVEEYPGVNSTLTHRNHR